MSFLWGNTTPNLTKFKINVMSTTIQEYLAFTRTTVVYPQDELLKLAYLSNGLASEFGESLIAVQHLSLPPSEDLTNTRSLLQSELGDILWYLIRLLDELNCTPANLLEDYCEHNLNPDSFSFQELADALVLSNVQPPDQDIYIHYLFKEIVIHIGDICGAIKKMIRDRISLEDVRVKVLPSLNSLFFDYILLIYFYHFEPQEILEYNLTKLSSRKKRSQLHGSGDFR